MARRKEAIVREGAKVYAYTRVSTIIQVDRYSLDAQMDSINRYAERYDMKVVREYSDKGKSGKNTVDRPAFMAMMDAIAEDKDGVKFVLVYKLSRFGRRTSEILQYIEYMQDYNVHLVCVDDNIDTSTDMGKLMVTVLGIVAENERENILSQTMEGRRRKAREGKWNGGITPFGYEASEDTLELTYPEAEIAKLIFDKFVNSPMPQATLANWLNDRGYRKDMKRPHERDKFTPRFITRMLRNPVYMGMIAYGKTTSSPTKDSPKYRKRLSFDEFDIADGAVPAIVSKEVWYQAQAKLDGQSGKSEKREKDHEYILGNLINCPKCGKTMYGRPSKGNKKNAKGELYPPYYSYVCRSYLHSQEKCGFGQIACHKIDNQMRDILMALTTAENFGDKMAELSHEHLDTSEVEALIDELKKRLRHNEFMQNKIEMEQLQLDTTDKYFNQRYASNERRLESVFEAIATTSVQLMDAENQLEAIKKKMLTRESIYESLTMFETIYDQMTDYEKKIFLRTFIDKIELYPDKSRKHGCFIKSIDFLFPVSYNGEKVYTVNLDRPADEVSPPYGSHVETIVTLRAEKVNGYIPVHLEVEELGEIPHIPPKAEVKKEKPQGAKLQTFGTATYSEIKEYCLEKHGLKVHSAHIAELKRDYGIKERENYFLPSGKNTRKTYNCTAERKAAILDAFKHFGMI